MKNEILIEEKNKRIEMIDYLKGYSILTIVLMHIIQGYIQASPSFLFKLASIGGAGVHVFFLCSGIGLYISYLKHKTSYIEFLKYRFLKIYIPYILVIFVSFFIPWLYSGSDRIQAMISHVFLYKMFIQKYEASFGCQFWFVSTIFQLYLLFIPMCKLKNKLNRSYIFFAIFFLISIFWWILVYLLGMSDVRIWNSFCFQYIWEFALGMCIGEYLLNGNAIILKKWELIVFAIAGIGLQAVMALSSDVLRIFNDIPALVGYSSLAMLLYSNVFCKWVGLKISDFSYELYCVHILVIATIFYLVPGDGLAIQIMIGIISLSISFIVAFEYKKIRRILKI